MLRQVQNPWHRVMTRGCLLQGNIVLPHDNAAAMWKRKPWFLMTRAGAFGKVPLDSDTVIPRRYEHLFRKHLKRTKDEFTLPERSTPYAVAATLLSCTQMELRHLSAELSHLQTCVVRGIVVRSENLCHAWSTLQTVVGATSQSGRGFWKTRVPTLELLFNMPLRLWPTRLSRQYDTTELSTGVPRSWLWLLLSVEPADSHESYRSCREKLPRVSLKNSEGTETVPCQSC